MEREQFNYKFIMALAGLIIVLNIFSVLFNYHNNTTFTTSEGDFKFSGGNLEDIVFMDREGNELLVDIENGTRNDISFAQSYKISYKSRLISVTSENFLDNGFVVEKSTGEVYVEKMLIPTYAINFPGSFIRSHGPITEMHEDVQLVYNIEEAMEYLRLYGQGSMFKKIASLVLFTLLGFCLIFLPNVAWKIDTFLWVKGGQPSNLYIFFSVFLGFIIIVISIIRSLSLIFS